MLQYHSAIDPGFAEIGSSPLLTQDIIKKALRATAISSGEAAPSPEDLAVAAVDRSRLLAALEQLPDAQRLVLECRYLLGLSEEATAAALGIRRGTVKSRAARALDRLREVHGTRV